LPSVAMSRAGHLVAAWQNYGTKYVGDLPGDGVFTQTFVDEPFRYSLPGGSDVIVLGGMPTTLKVDLTRDAGSSAPLTIGVANLPPGVTYTVSPPAAGAPRTEERTITFNAPNNVAAAYNFAAQLQLSTPGYSTLTPGMNFTVTPSYIGSVLGPNSDHTKFLKGLPLTIQGAGFVPGSKVQFGSSGALVTPTSIASNGTSLTVSVPMTAPNGPLTIVRPGGSSLVSASVTYSAPAITLVEQKEGWAHENVSAGTVVRIDGYGFLPGTKVQFGDPDHLDATAEVGALAVDPGGNWLTVEVPTLAVNGAVSVIVPTGSAATTLRSVDTFTVRNYRDTFGFAFHNFTFNVSFPLVSDTFGAAQTHVTVWNPFGDDVVTPVPTPGALAFTAAAAIGINGNGACFGICVTTLDLQRNYDLYRTDVGLPAGALPEPHNLVRDGGLTTYTERRHLTQLSQQVIDSVLKWAAAPHATNDVYNQVRGMILNHDNPILSIHNSLTDGHCVVGYDVLNEVRDASGKVTAFDIDVYDPN